jgi:hypothetical protein
LFSNCNFFYIKGQDDTSFIAFTLSKHQIAFLLLFVDCWLYIARFKKARLGVRLGAVKR